MSRYIVLLVLFVGLAGTVPYYLEGYATRHPDPARDNASPTAVPNAAVATTTAPAPGTGDLGSGRSALLQPNAEGHFTGTFRINGRSVRAMIDTGATEIAMNETTAREVGIALPESAFIYPVTTANGTTRAARATLGSVEVGRVHVEDVSALVLRDSALSQTLIGMSFLGRLRSYQVRNGILALRN